MMSLAISLTLALQGASAATPDEAQREIVILGAKMKLWTAAATKTRCWTLTSSGDEAIDAIGCAVMKTCVGQWRPQLKAARKKRRTVEGKASYKAKYYQFETCVALGRDTEIAKLAERRFQARQGLNDATN